MRTLLDDDGGVDVLDLPPGGDSHDGGLAEKVHGVGAGQRRVAGGEVLPDVGENTSPEDSISHGMGQHVPIGRGADADRVRDADPTNDQRWLTIERVCVESPSDTGADSRHSAIPRPLRPWAGHGPVS